MTEATELEEEEADLFAEEEDGPDLSHIAEDLRGLARPIAGLVLDPRNARKHPERNLAATAESLETFGQRKPIVVNRNGMVVEAGNGTLEAARAMAEEDGRWSWLAQVLVDDDPATATGFGLADNRTAELAEWDGDRLLELVRELEGADELTGVGWDEDELAGLYADLDPPPKPERKTIKAVPVPEHPVSELDAIYELGPHRLLCGDAGKEYLVRRLLDAGGVEGRELGMIVTDPPYCSGGFQESSRRRGSVGTDAKHKAVANDTLSTRGYQALLRRVLGHVDAKLAYVFTDWRMWVNLFDVMESLGYGVRAMVVWNKGNPGMGRGWRNQHELVMCSCRDTDVFADLKRAQGNVITCPRTRNDLHTTQKPIDVLETIIGVAADGTVPIYDPFAGAGSTCIAAGKRPTLMAELEPGYCDIIRWRWGEFARANGIPAGADALAELGAPHPTRQ